MIEAEQRIQKASTLGLWELWVGCPAWETGRHGATCWVYVKPPEDAARPWAGSPAVDGAVRASIGIQRDEIPVMSTLPRPGLTVRLAFCISCPLPSV